MRISYKGFMGVLVAVVSMSALLFAGCGDDSASGNGGGNGGGSGDGNGGNTGTTALAVSGLAADILNLTSVRLTWNNPAPSNLKDIRVSWATVEVPNTAVGSHTVTSASAGAEASYTVARLMTNTDYRFSVTAVYTDRSTSTAATVDRKPSIDSDGDRLIDIHNLDMLNNIRYTLDGAAYQPGLIAAPQQQCGSANDQSCIGYELMRNLNFATATDYASGSVNNAWRPTNAGGMVVASTSAINAGWVPIGVDAAPFATTLDGRGYSIDNLYVRNHDHTHMERVGLFGAVGGVATPGTVRNIFVKNGNTYGGNMGDEVGIIAGRLKNGTISSSGTIGSNADGGAGQNSVGALVAHNEGVIVASYATGTAVGGSSGMEAMEAIGGLVGANQSGGSIIASYATGTADGGSGNDVVGGLVGYQNNGSITASYAIGTANGGAGTTDRVGSLVGYRDTSNVGTITVSYGFGSVMNGSGGSAGDAKPSGVTGSGIVAARKLTAPGTAAATAAPATWNAAANNTLGVWDFGTAMQAPALKYADYDDTGTAYSCDQFPLNACGTLIRGQEALR